MALTCMVKAKGMAETKQVQGHRRKARLMDHSHPTSVMGDLGVTQLQQGMTTESVPLGICISALLGQRGLMMLISGASSP